MYENMFLLAGVKLTAVRCIAGLEVCCLPRMQVSISCSDTEFFGSLNITNLTHINFAIGQCECAAHYYTVKQAWH